jgi:pantetheine-phosphate adenylyltransferase
MRKAIYAGSFNPFTYGHLSIVEKGAAIFDALHIVIGVNSNKPSDFLPVVERQRAIEQTLSEVSLYNVTVLEHNGLIADLAQSINVTHLVRGLRPLGDFENEYNMAMINRDLREGFPLETVFLLADPATAHMSSTFVRELLRFGASVERFVPPAVWKVLKENGLV